MWIEITAKNVITFFLIISLTADLFPCHESSGVTNDINYVLCRIHSLSKCSQLLLSLVPLAVVPNVCSGDVLFP